MSSVAIYDLATGNVIATRTADIQPDPDAGTGHFELTPGQQALGMQVSGYELVPIPPSIDDVRAAKWNDAKAYRYACMAGVCTTPSGVVQIDDASKLKINGAVNMAMLAEQAGQPFSVNWTLNDNSVVALDAKAMIGVGLAVGGFVSACQDAGSAIRDKIDAASTVEDVEAIDVTTGYPAS